MLKLSKKADYALMALQYMGSIQFSDLTKARVVNTKEIAEENNIPVELLAKVLQALEWSLPVKSSISIEDEPNYHYKDSSETICDDV